VYLRDQVVRVQDCAALENLRNVANDEPFLLAVDSNFGASSDIGAFLRSAGEADA
jgi:hypothetical protein